MLKISARRSPTSTGCCVCVASAASMPIYTAAASRVSAHAPRVKWALCAVVQSSGRALRNARSKPAAQNNVSGVIVASPHRRHRPCHALVVHRLTRPSQPVRHRGHAPVRCCCGSASITRGSARFSARLPRGSLDNDDRTSHHAWHCRATLIALSVHSTRPRFAATGTSGYYFRNVTSIISCLICAWRCSPAGAPSRLHFSRRARRRVARPMIAALRHCAIWFAGVPHTCVSSFIHHAMVRFSGQTQPSKIVCEHGVAHASFVCVAE